jgi:glutamate/tyrosine decarboxylase-like PLP-dependent enzyme
MGSNSYLAQLQELEKISRQLEPDAQQRKLVREGVVNYTEDFINNIETLSTFTKENAACKEIFHAPILEEATPLEEVISSLKIGLDEGGINPASGGHLGYIPAGGIYYSALGDYWADITNRFAGLFFASPGAVRMENRLIQWTADLAGYPSDAVGYLASGGSLANLSAIVTARDHQKITSEKVKKAVVYLSPEGHHCAQKALRIAGLSECVIRELPLDECYRIQADALEKCIVDDKAQGLIPFLVIASGGTTGTGSVDPLEAIGKITQKYRLWYHVDAAYGGYFLLTDHGKKVLKGIELSDSFAIDPHKSLFLPYGLGILIVKNKQALLNSHYYQSKILQDAQGFDEELSPADLSPELTKHFRGLRMWLPLKLLGLKPFRACLDEKLLLARYFYDEVKKLGFEMGPYPELSVVTYRYPSKKHNVNAFNKRLVEEIQKDGRLFISSTMLEDRLTLRLGALCFRTHLATVDLLLSLLKEKVETLEANNC